MFHVQRGLFAKSVSNAMFQVLKKKYNFYIQVEKAHRNRWNETHLVLSPTFVKEGDVVILYRSKVNIFPKIRLLWGVRHQKTLSMESLLWEWGVKAV